MKNIKIQIIGLTLIAATAVSCNNSSNKDSSNTNNDTGATTEKVVTKEFSISPIITNYLDLKNALAADDSKGASEAGKQLLAGLARINMDNIPAGSMKQYMEIADDTRENAEHIRDNAGKIDHQREHLEFLSKDVLALISLFGSPQKLYQIHCPMFNDGKGADWVSESRDIVNPYYGREMTDCGEVVKELK